ncbi:COX assembly mitochondrial protein homolog [Copidosoma floridanum]|uniref:COX assembly mitochondrial protein homolog n=1 Tax=Copidosoma floridanum TaxID=29053 RepID=UPI0006C976C2|nr:COX assembly mitochondrial protein homolog [Copidosoma floridanum]
MKFSCRDLTADQGTMKTTTMAEQEQKIHEKDVEKKNIYSWKGGPMGLGDPDDEHLRKVEKDVLIAKMVRDRTREEKCIPEVEEFNKCCKSSKYMMVVKCRKENSELKKCLEHWYKDEQLWEECRIQYLKDRSEFRRTGVPKKIREFQARYKSNM